MYIPTFKLLLGIYIKYYGFLVQTLLRAIRFENDKITHEDTNTCYGK